MKLAYKMKLFSGKMPEYKRRHDTIWPELVDLLKSAGISDYSIFLEEDTDFLFAVLEVEDRQSFDALPSHPVMQQWWLYMSDIMETNPDNSPLSIPLNEVFFLA